MRPVKSQVQIKGKGVTGKLGSLTLSQQMDGHHHFSLLLKEIPEGGEKESLKAITPANYTGFLGEPIQIKIETLDKVLTFEGIITGIQFRNAVGDVNQVLVTGSSPTLLMDLSPKNRFFHEKKLDAIAKEILKAYSLKYDCKTSSSLSRPFTVQYQETDYDFLTRLAQEEGIWTYYDGVKFWITSENSKEPIRLRWRENLLEFSLGLRTRPLYHETNVYNYKEKKTFYQTTKSLRAGSSLPDFTQLAQKVSEKIHPETAYLNGNLDATDQKELDNRLQVLKSAEIGQMVVGVGRGDLPGIVSGQPIEVTGMEKFDGQYLVTQITHTCNETGQYECYFECVPQGSAHPRWQASQDHFQEVQSAVVTDTNDPDKLGRVKVKFHWNEGKEETPWIRISTLSAGGGRGSYWIPEKDDEVLVAFRHNDPSQPVVIGSLYTGKDKPRDDLPDPKDNVKAFVTKGGNTILFRDNEGKEEILINTKDLKNQVSLKMGSTPTITIKTEGNIAMECKDMAIKTKGNFTCTVSGEAEIKADKKAILKGKQDGVEIEGSKTSIKGPMQGVAIEGMKTDIKGSSMVEIKSAIVKIN